LDCWRKTGIYPSATDLKLEVIEHVLDKSRYCRKAQRHVIVVTANSSGCYYGEQWTAYYAKRTARQVSVAAWRSHSAVRPFVLTRSKGRQRHRPDLVDDDNGGNVTSSGSREGEKERDREGSILRRDGGYEYV